VARRVQLCVLLGVALLACLGHVHVRAAASDTDSASELDQSILDSAAAEIQQQLDLEAEANQNYAGHAIPVLEAGSAEARAFESSGVDIPAAEPSTFAFLSELEAPVTELAGADVESDLNTIATELDSLFKSKAQIEAEAEAEQAKKHTAQGRLAKARIAQRKARALQQAKAAAKAQAAAEKKAASTPAPKPVASRAAASPRPAKLAQRLDGYRVARGHKEEISTLEATAAAHSSNSAGYSLPSAYAPAVVGAVAPAVAWQGQVAVNPQWNAWAALGLAPPAAPVVAAAAVPAASANIAGVGALLQALKKVEEEQKAQSMLTKLSALISAQTNAAALQQQAAAAAVQPSPFNYGQTLYATPQGFVNPNLLPNPTLTPRLMPGSVPGMSPAYPTYIPENTASVGVETEQPNPFEAHSP
jgi:hypothetical protein